MNVIGTPLAYYTSRNQLRPTEKPPVTSASSSAVPKTEGERQNTKAANTAIKNAIAGSYQSYQQEDASDDEGTPLIPKASPQSVMQRPLSRQVASQTPQNQTAHLPQTPPSASKKNPPKTETHSNENTSLFAGGKAKTYGGEEEKAVAEEKEDKAWAAFVTKQGQLKEKKMAPPLKDWVATQQGVKPSEINAWFWSQK